MSKDRLMRIDSTEYQDMIQRVLRATKLTSRLNVLPFEDEAGKGEMFEQILGRPLAPNTTIYPPFYTDHGLRLELGEHRLSIRMYVSGLCRNPVGRSSDDRPYSHIHHHGHPVDPEDRRGWLSGAPIDVGDNYGSAPAR
jgi:hypothetical protein